MRTAAQHIHALAGATAFAGCDNRAGRCWLCGEPHARAIPVGKWQGANFTDQNKARCPESAHVCEPCAWACSWVQPPGFPSPEPGKKGLNLRLFSHCWDERGYHAWNKADKPAIRAWLRAPKQGAWFAAIADTGQKHLLPWTPVNPPHAVGVVRFEERSVRLCGEPGWALVDDMTALLGVTTKAELDAEAVQQRLLASENATELDDAKAKDAAKSSMLPRRFERVCAGSLFHWSLTATTHSALDEATLWVMVASFLANARVGGKKGTGHGLLRPVAARHIDIRRPRELARELEAGEQAQKHVGAFQAHVQERAGRIRDFLATVAG